MGLFKFKSIPVLNILKTCGLFFAFVYCGCLYSQTSSPHLDSPYNDNIFLIYSYLESAEDNLSISEILNNNADGMVLRLTADHYGNIRLNSIKSGQAGLREALILLRKSLEKDSLKVFTLVLDLDFDASLLKGTFSDAGLDRYLFTYIPGSDWPSLRFLTGKNQRLIVFTRRSVINQPEWMNSLTELAIEPGFTSNDELVISDELIRSDPAKNLLVFNGYLHKYLQYEGDFNTYTRNRPHVIDLFLETWTATGRIPNFILVDNQNWLSSDLLIKLRSFGLVRGMVTYHSRPIQNIQWEGMKSITPGTFCFPILQGEQLMLKPHKPGYRFRPKKIIIEQPSGNSPVQFDVLPELLAKDLEAYYTLTKNVQDLSPRNRNGNAKNVKFIKDADHGSVAWLSPGSSIGIGKAANLNMTDHDFTVSVWLKIPKYQDAGEDNVVLGSRTFAYQRGLHLIIRQRKPYMGFFNNDLAGITEIPEGRWMHVVWRYNKYSGEQAIFVNGRLDANAYNRPSYKGTDSLIVGIIGFKAQEGFRGQLSDLIIWSRALGEDEIAGLYNKTIHLPMRDFFYWRWPIWVGPLIIFCILMMVTGRLIIHRRSRSKLMRIKPNHPVKKDNIKIASQDINVIRLFGDFTVLDKAGQDITHQFTPKLKKLFIALLVYSAEAKNGLTPRQISEMLWEEKDTRDTKNKRSVTLRNLRIALSGLPGILINVEDHWKIQIPDSIYCDYYLFQKIIKNTRQNSPEFFGLIWDIISRGELLKDESDPWLDEVKADTGNYIIDYLTGYLDQPDAASDDQLFGAICDQIFLYDPTNESALVHKIKSLVIQNKLSQAKRIYDRYCTEYFELYAEKYILSFNELIKR